MTRDEKHLVLLGQISCMVNLSEKTACSKRKQQKQREHQKTSCCIESNPVCRETFKFVYAICSDTLSYVLNFYKKNGLVPRAMVSNGKHITKRRHKVLTYEDVTRVVSFTTNFAEEHALVLPGRIPGFKRADIRVLPSTETRSSVWRKYKVAMNTLAFRAVGNSTFRKLWRQLVSSVVIGRPMTDLCWQCQQNNHAIYRSSNLPECVKHAKLKKQEHLRVVSMERDLYKKMVDRCKATAAEDKLGEHIPCSREAAVHYSFDFAQQVHYPSDPLQPGPIYFLCPRKCGLFGVCCEGIPQQVNYLIDEAHCSSKGSCSVISYLDHFFKQYGLGEKDVHLHCDNCSGQNKNKYMLWYLAWRCIIGLHENITLNFLIAGHIKFSTDWCFGLLKQKYRRTPVSCLKDIAETVKASTLSGMNIPQLVGTEDGNVFVPTHDWQTFLTQFFRPLEKIKSLHHFRFTAAEPGVVYYKEHQDSAEEKFVLLKPGVSISPAEKPQVVPSPGLDPKRAWYLYDKICDFCEESAQDVTCPRPTTDRPTNNEPESTDGTVQQAEKRRRLDTGGGSTGELGNTQHSRGGCRNARSRGRGRGGRGRGRESHSSSDDSDCVLDSAHTRGRGGPSGTSGRRGRGRGRGTSTQ